MSPVMSLNEPMNERLSSCTLSELTLTWCSRHYFRCSFGEVVGKVDRSSENDAQWQELQQRQEFQQQEALYSIRA